jgi:membrane fusion protein (multidrug efflux system)
MSAATAMKAEDTQAPIAVVPPPVPAPTPVPERKPRRSRRFLLMVGLPLILAVVGGYFYLTAGRYQDTDNAYAQQAKVQLSASVAGHIVEVSVAENQAVAAGDEILRIDPEPYQIALDQADAAVASARVEVERLRAAYEQAVAAERSSAENLTYLQAEYDRAAALVQRGISSEASQQEAQRDLSAASEEHTSAVQGVVSARAALGGNPDILTDDHPAVMQALAARAEAAYELGRTVVRAPADGVVSQVGLLNVGQFIQVGTPIASLVESHESWVTANFKETQLAFMEVGQEAEVAFDALPGRTFHAHIESVGAGTGSEFSLIPAQNASGNWVKVVQRVPVRLVLDDIGDARIVTGYSASVTVDTGPGHTDLDLVRNVF